MNAREPHRLDLSIVPGKCLGWFRLGTSIWDVINSLRDQSRSMPSVDFKYSEESPLSIDLFISLPGNGMHLRFDAPTQRLKSIEVYDFSKVRLAYQDSEVSSSKVVPNCLLIYEIFGPTYPGEFDPEKKEYTLNYPIAEFQKYSLQQNFQHLFGSKGVSFVFPIPEEYLSIIKTSADLPLELPDGTSPLLSHLYIYHGTSFRSTIPPPLIRSSNADGIAASTEEVGEVETVIAKLKHGIDVKFVSALTKIVLNVTTPQDLLVEIGAPLRVFYKEEDKMRIHSEENVAKAFDDVENAGPNAATNGIDDRSSADGHPIDYFYNYFHLGFDVLFDGATHRCKKIVLHGNVPGHYDFQRYKRCPYKLTVPQTNHDTNQAARFDVQDEDDEEEGILESLISGTSQEKYITGDQKIDSIYELWGQPSGRPLIFNRGSSGQNPFGPTELIGYDGAIFEIMKNRHIATITLF
ncbi:12557_t:CDS:10 [Ambispora gerdemannii]|uniref:12557_t:CDS:1 n=1 Tax=Ambispora gerdemannii TaxID=144530 RepID=A0A9N9A604_9GLOM|nr:12557_t:CDS:10 [Ambispora gerdemannii]